jgi:hypothetical protein
VAEFLASVRDGSEAGYAAPAVLDGVTLAAISEANGAFLELLAASAEERPGATALGLPRAMALKVRALDSAARAQIADCPYTLFNLRFEEPAFWSSLLRQRAPGGGEPAARVAFARTAVFFAWHLAHSNELAAALVLGMSTEVRRAFRAIPLSVLERATHVVLPHLTARFGTHPTFWQRLLDGAESRSAASAESARLLGLQLLAAAGAWPAAATAPLAVEVR